MGCFQPNCNTRGRSTSSEGEMMHHDLMLSACAYQVSNPKLRHMSVVLVSLRSQILYEAWTDYMRANSKEVEDRV